MKKLRSFRVGLFLLLACASTLPDASAAPQTKTVSAARVSSHAVKILRRVPSRATLSQLKNILPRATRYINKGQASQGDWTWNVIHFRAKDDTALEGVAVFANDRAKYARLRPAKNETERQLNIEKAVAWRANDVLHSLSIFLGDERTNSHAKIIERETRQQVQTLSNLLGRPASRQFHQPGSGPGDEGWSAEWKQKGRTFYYGETLALLDGDARPQLELWFSYSQIYQA